MEKKKIRVRYAPSPTGYLHIGNARTALFNYLFARKNSGSFIIRIEDTDIKRNIEGGEISQLEYLKWLGIDWDESIDIGGDYGPYRQSERLVLYRKHAQNLLEDKRAYLCYCTEDELIKEREEQMARGENPFYSGRCRNLTAVEVKQFESEGRRPSIRYLVPKEETYNFCDLVKGEVSVGSEEIGDWVIIKKDGIATYNFAVVIDDHFMEISHVLRGDDHLTNTPKQIMVYEAFGWDIPQFGHMTLIVNEDRKKLSKRDESIVQFIEQYKEKGFVPEALFNFIALLGWHPGGEEEFLSKKQLIGLFAPERLSKSPAFFDQKKLTWLNQQYIRKLSTEELLKYTSPFLIKAGFINQVSLNVKKEWLNGLVDLYRDYLSCGEEIAALTSSFFHNNIVYDQKSEAMLKEDYLSSVFTLLLQKFSEMEDFNELNIKLALKQVQKETGEKGKRLFMPVRIALFGQDHGPDLVKSIMLLGQEKVVARITVHLN